MKNTTITSLLGLTQNQMALLLQVSRAQWSMYDAGKRGLPLKSRQLLAEMIGFLKFEDKGVKLLELMAAQEEAKKVQLQKQFRRNEYDLYEINKKIGAAELRYNSSLAAIGLVAYLEGHPNLKLQLDGELLNIIASGAERTLAKSGLAQLTELQMKQERLELEKLIISSALNKMTKNP